MLTERELLEKAAESVVRMIQFNASGSVIDSSDVFRQVTGYTREEVESGMLHWRMLTPPEWIEESERQWQQGAAVGT